MSTRSYIAKQVGPDQYRTIFCHFDGYLEHVGAMLAGHYDTEEMVDVVFFNDDVTTVEFVIKVLMTVFFLPKEKAVKLTFKVDEEGSAVAGTYTIDIAKSKIPQII